MMTSHFTYLGIVYDSNRIIILSNKQDKMIIFPCFKLLRIYKSA